MLTVDKAKRLDIADNTISMCAVIIDHHCSASKIQKENRKKMQGDREKARVFETLNFCEKG